MNFLAHLHLADPTPESRLGNLLGDFVRGLPDDDRFPPEIWEGIKLHRHVDAFTDSDPAWKRSRARLKRTKRRFAGIIIDVFYDHFLIRNWSRFEPEREMPDFVADCHAHLDEALHHAPLEAAEVIRRMQREDWLISYSTLEGLDFALQRISRRSAILSPVANSVGELEENFEAMEEDFLEFYPRAIQFAKKWKRINRVG
ncbi:MAG: DUF479 domain-containing protein [Verrucomicrobiales bacterium]|nr:DUF479 domain-containing protein [Verrucomicrobiales bacterium]